MECIGTATTLVLVNGSPTNKFPMERGLLQGDPLSLFLFFIIVEGQNVIMSSLVEASVFSGYKVRSNNLMQVSHLQFANDTLIMGEKTWGNVRAM